MSFTSKCLKIYSMSILDLTFENTTKVVTQEYNIHVYFLQKFWNLKQLPILETFFEINGMQNKNAQIKSQNMTEICYSTNSKFNLITIQKLLIEECDLKIKLVSLL